MHNAPLHIAIIPDGNRRWAKERSMLPWKGHEQSAQNFRSILEWCRSDDRIGVLTFWCFSTENWKRDSLEIDVLMKLLESYLQKERVSLKENGVRVVHSGRKDRIPASIVALLNDMEHDTEPDAPFVLNLAIDYGGKDEVIRAVQHWYGSTRSDDANTIATEEAVRQHLDHPELPDIDLIIRTSGEYRTSNFALWQSAYAEWVFLEKHFPDIGPADVEEALEEFGRRERRRGR